MVPTDGLPVGFSEGVAVVVGVDGFVDALIAVHPVDAQVVDFVALFAGATYDDRAVQFEAADVGRLEYAVEDVGDLLVADVLFSGHR